MWGCFGTRSWLRDHSFNPDARTQRASLSHGAGSAPGGNAQDYPQLNFFTDAGILPSVSDYQQQPGSPGAGKDRGRDTKSTSNKTLYIGGLGPAEICCGWPSGSVESTPTR